MFGFYSSVFWEDNTIIDNWSLFSGGGVYLKFGTGDNIERCVIAGNESQFGGGVYMENYAGVQVINCTIADNNAVEWGGGLYIYNFCYPEIINSIIWGNTADTLDNLFVSYSDSVCINYCDVEGGWAGMGNIDSDPLFAEAGNFDYQLTWANYPVSDSTKSPCIDAGNPAPEFFDKDGTRCDMGAFYFPQTLVVIDDLTMEISGEDAVLRWNSALMAVEYRIYTGEMPYFQIAGEPEAVVFPPDTIYLVMDWAEDAIKFFRITVIYYEFSNTLGLSSWEKKQTGDCFIRCTADSQ